MMLAEVAEAYHNYRSNYLGKKSFNMEELNEYSQQKIIDSEV